MPLIDTSRNVVTLINTFQVKPDQCDALLDHLIRATNDVMRHQPGFVSASFHRNPDSTRVANYAQWESRAAFEAMLARDEVAPHLQRAEELAESVDPVLYEVVFTEERSGEH